MILNEDLFEDVPNVEINDLEQSEIEPEAPEGIDAGVSTLLIDAINHDFEMINEYNSMIATIDGYEETDEYSEQIKSGIEEMLVDLNNHIGKLQGMLQLVSPNASEIEAGQEEVQLSESLGGGKKYYTLSVGYDIGDAESGPLIKSYNYTLAASSPEEARQFAIEDCHNDDDYIGVSTNVREATEQEIIDATVPDGEEVPYN